MDLRCFCQYIRLAGKRYSKGDWGFRFVVGFLLLLFSAAVILGVSNVFTSDVSSVNYQLGRELASVAENVTTIAYFSLATGVVLQVLYVSKDRGRIE